MRKRVAWMLVAALVGQSPVHAELPAEPYREQAKVYASDNGQWLYREEHLILPGAKSERWVLYRCANGEAFARKHVQTLQRAQAPNFAFEDARDGFREGVRGATDARRAYLDAADKTETARALQIPPDGVIDAGFDAAVRANWDALMRGDVVRLQFLIPSRMRFYPVRVQRSASIDWNGLRAERLRMRLDLWFGFAVPEVTLVYARDDRRLLEFSGTGNIRDARGRNPQVRIEFEPEPQPGSRREVDAMRRAPLSGHCSF